MNPLGWGFTLVSSTTRHFWPFWWLAALATFVGLFFGFGLRLAGV